jgi:hypothetical protein
MRYRIQLVEPSPPGSDQRGGRRQGGGGGRGQAPSRSGRCTDRWLPYTRYGTPEARLETAIAHITARGDFVVELSSLMLSEDPEIRADVVRVASYYMQQWAGVTPLPTDPKPGGG